MNECVMGHLTEQQCPPYPDLTTMTQFLLLPVASFDSSSVHGMDLAESCVGVVGQRPDCSWPELPCIPLHHKVIILKLLEHVRAACACCTRGTEGRRKKWMILTKII
jgi:hypothetical protein